MRSVWIIGLAGLLGACAASGGHVHHGDAHQRTVGSLASDIPLEWYPLQEARRMANEQGKPIIVDFYAPESCSRCDKMALHVWGNPQIAEMVRQDFILVRIDLTRNLARDEIELGRKYDYNFNCLLIFLDYLGEVIEDVGGNRMCFSEAIDPEWFIRYLERAREKGGRSS